MGLVGGRSPSLDYWNVSTQRTPASALRVFQSFTPYLGLEVQYVKLIGSFKCVPS